MYYANTNDGKSKAQPGVSGTCPSCGDIVIPKCGEINAWHWAHKSLEECDTWSEGETDWHINWKLFFPPELTEVTIEKNGKKHRADVKLSTGLVIEFQNSPISIEEIRERNQFWGKVLWVFNSPPKSDPQFEWSRKKEGFDIFVWKRARKSARELGYFMIDLHHSLFSVHKANFDRSPVRGWGHIKNKYTFLLDDLKIENEWEKTGNKLTLDPKTLTLRGNFSLF